MKKTLREKIISNSRKKIKKAPYLKWPIVITTKITLACLDGCMLFPQNAKRLVSIGVLFVFFMTSSSFASLSACREYDASLLLAKVDDSGITLMAEQEIDEKQVEEIDNTEVENYDDVELLGAEELDTYTIDDILEGNSDYRSIVEERPIEAKNDYKEYDFKEDDWRLILVNKQHTIPESYEFPLGTIKGNLQCDERIMEDLLAMLSAAKDDEVDLVICSPYRDYNRQTVLFNRKITNYMNAGMSYMDAYKIASMTVTSPNASEHRIGLAIDFYSSSYTSLDEGFADTQAGIWLAEHSYEYGFVLRYPKDKEYITGIEYEPWHFRYVGMEAATYMTMEGITLEEFWEDM